MGKSTIRFKKTKKYACSKRIVIRDDMQTTISFYKTPSCRIILSICVSQRYIASAFSSGSAKSVI